MILISPLKRVLTPGYLLLVCVVLSSCSLVPKDQQVPISQSSAALGFPRIIRDEAGRQVATPLTPSEAAASSSATDRLVEVFFATDRKPNLDSTRNPYFLGEPATRENPIYLGTSYVSIPKNHEPGVLETPRWWKFEFEDNPDKHITVKSVNLVEPQAFLQQLNSRAAEADQERGMGRQALVFIHGYNTSFELALRRTGQLAWDLDFPGVPITFSWPSAGRLTKYTQDEHNAVWAIPHLANLLINLQENTNVEKIHIIAHSMGTRVLTNAIIKARDRGFELKLANVVLAAPDIDAGHFKADLMPQIKTNTKRLTLFANSKDRALVISSRIHKTPRLGSSGRNIVVLPGMDTIDATQVDRSLTGHEYFGGNSLMLRDMRDLIVYEETPEERRLRKQVNGSWTFFR